MRTVTLPMILNDLEGHSLIQMQFYEHFATFCTVSADMSRPAVLGNS